MSDLFWLTDEQIERLRPFFPKSHGTPRVSDRRVLSGIVFVNKNALTLARLLTTMLAPIANIRSRRFIVISQTMPLTRYAIRGWCSREASVPCRC
jgi:transposase